MLKFYLELCNSLMKILDAFTAVHSFKIMALQLRMQSGQFVVKNSCLMSKQNKCDNSCFYVNVFDFHPTSYACRNY